MESHCSNVRHDKQRFQKKKKMEGKGSSVRFRGEKGKGVRERLTRKEQGGEGRLDKTDRLN